MDDKMNNQQAQEYSRVLQNNLKEEWEEIPSPKTSEWDLSMLNNHGILSFIGGVDGIESWRRAQLVLPHSHYIRKNKHG